MSMSMPNPLTVGGTQVQESSSQRLRVQQDGTQTFYEDWSSGSLDVLYNWNAATTSSGASGTASSGAYTLATGTTASSYVYLTSKASFQPTSPGFLEFDHQTQLTNPIPAHTYSFFGSGNPASTPTSLLYATDAVGFETSVTGKMYAVCWAGSTRNQIADLSSTGNNTQPLDGAVHRYQTYVRGDTIYWVIDNVTVAQILTGALGPNVNTLPVLMQAGNDATGSASSLSMINAAAYVGDSTKAIVQTRAYPGIISETTPSVSTATSTTILAANVNRKYVFIQNNSAANIMISLSGKTLTGIVPTATNIGLVLTPNSSFEAPPNLVPTSIITAYQTSGGTINTIYVGAA